MTLDKFQRAISRFTKDTITSEDSKIQSTLLAWNKKAIKEGLEPLESISSSKFYPYPIARLRVSESISKERDSVLQRFEDYGTKLEYATSTLLEHGISVRDNDDTLEFEFNDTGVVYKGDVFDDETVEEIILAMPLIGKKYCITRFALVFQLPYLVSKDNDDSFSDFIKNIEKSIPNNKDVELLDIVADNISQNEVTVLLGSWEDISIDVDFINEFKDNLDKKFDDSAWLVLYKGTVYNTQGTGYGGLKDLEWEESIFDTEVFYPDLENGELVSSKIYKGVCYGLAKNSNVRKIIKSNNDKSNKMLSSGIENNDLSMVKKAIKMGANVYYNDNIALRKSTQYGYFDIVKFLISIGADVNSLDDYPIILAVRKGYLDIVKLLVENGADINVTYRDNTLLDIAEKQGNQEIVDYLISKGAK